jgi:hypothetical protein
MNAVAHFFHFFHFCHTRWQELNPSYKKYLSLGVFFTLWIFLISFGFVLFQKNDHLSKSMLQMEKTRETALIEQISNIRAQLDKLGVGTQNATQASNMNRALVTLEKEVTGTAKSEELQKIAADMESRLDELEKTVTDSAYAKHYVDAKTLPFQVVSVDVISGQVFVSVDYERRMVPLGIGDSLAGWKVIDADYDHVSVELVNNQGQYIKIDVPEKQESVSARE